MRLRHTVTAVTAALLLTATACGSSGDSGSKDDHGKPAGTPSPSTSAEREGQYIVDAQDVPFTSRRPSNEELLAYPGEWCKALDAGHSVKWMFSGGGGDLYPIGQDWGTKEANAYRLLLVGVKAYCPQHTAAVMKELRETGKY